MKKEKILVTSLIALGTALVVLSLILINFQRTGYLSEFNYMKDFSTGIVLGVGGFILASSGIKCIIDKENKE
ncbi:hypothetical protein DDZ13_08900 [Coraliomargarita sinensis]|uniref:Uncharacterized protein n=1 Tax=Coraliomargarita sinensis TaxID=2174842 RepID=A0A317ZIM1_9BACT|nr:hypothetical protein DDZ13_08900 [Coraliomargarita sinensis]